MQMKRQPWQDWVNLAFGVWLLIGPMVGVTTQPDTVAAFNGYLAGLGIASFAILRIGNPSETRWAEWLNISFGAWLLLAPLAVGYTDEPVASLNHVIVGALVVAMSAWSRQEWRAPTPTA